MSRSFVKFVFTLFIIVGFANISQAQDEANITRPSTKAGSAAWVFSFGGLSTLSMTGVPIGTVSVPEATTFNDVSLTGAGWKYYLADEMALRVGLGFGTSSSGDADPTKFSGGKTSKTAFGINAGIEMHTRAVYSTSPYFGAQINFASGSYTNTSTVGSSTTEVKGSGTAFGLSVLAGFDWYFTHAIAIGGEYTLGFGTSSSSATRGGTTTDLPSSTNIGIGNANIHLVVHF